MLVREARTDEMSAVGELRIAAYRAQNLLTANPGYADTLRALGADGHGTVLVAVEDTGTTPILGTVTLEHWHDASEVARGPDETEIRALAVAPRAQRRGIGRALVRAAVERSAAREARRVVLSTQPAMTTAQRLYLAEGFTRIPDRDWTPVPGITLLAFERLLAGREDAVRTGRT